MTATKPRIAYYNVFALTPRFNWCTSAESGHSHRKAVDWKIGTHWRPKWSSNELDNWDFLTWTGGASARPDDWSESAAMTYARVTTSKVGPYACQVTNGTGAEAYIYQSITPTSWLGKMVGFGIHGKLVSGAPFIRITDGVVDTDADPWTDTGDFAWIAAQHIVDKDAASLQVRIVIPAGAAVILDGAYFGERGSYYDLLLVDDLLLSPDLIDGVA